MKKKKVEELLDLYYGNTNEEKKQNP